MLVTAAPPDLDLGSLAHLLFACPVQPSQHPSPAAIRKAVAAQFHRCGGEVAASLGEVAQEAGDHPDSYVLRMRWAIRSVTGAYAGRSGVTATARTAA
jgi:hypothetical protein